MAATATTAIISTRGIEPNSTAHGIVAISVLLGVIATIVCAGRFWARKLTGLNWSWDDWLALASLIVNHAFMTFTVTAAVNGGLGQSLVVIMTKSPASVVTFLKCVLASELCYGISSPLIKLSLLAFYWRLFPTRLVRVGVIVLVVACLMWTLAIFIVNLLECRPISYMWTQLADPSGGTCIDIVFYFLCNAVANSIIDILTLVLPVHEVMKLQMSKSKKVGIVLVFGLGSIVVIASFVRLGSLADLMVVGVTDMTLQYALMWTATVVEIYIAIIGACAVTLVPVYRKLRTGNAWSTQGRGGMHSDYGRSGASNAHIRSAGARAAHSRIHDDDSEEYLRGTGRYAWRDTKVVGTVSREDERSVEDVPLEGIVVKRDVMWKDERVSVP